VAAEKTHRSKFGTELRLFRKAGFQLLLTTTRDPKRFRDELHAFHQMSGTAIVTWDINQKFTTDSAMCANGDLKYFAKYPGFATNAPASPNAPMQALDMITGADGPPDALFVLYNFHPYLAADPSLRTRLQTLFTGNAFCCTRFDEAGNDRSYTRTVLLVQPTATLHPEIQHLFETLPLALPTTDEIAVQVDNLLTSAVDPNKPELIVRMAAAARGLTSHQVEDALSLNLIRYPLTNPLLVPGIQAHKCRLINASGLVSYYDGQETFADLGGLAALKSFCSRALRPNRPKLAQAKGVLLLGPPGSGKSAFAKALGRETNRPTIALDIGALMGSLVGQTEENVRAALAIADACAPCILFIDEVEKALSGSQSSGRTDSGVTARMFGSILTWLNDHESDVFFIATSNDIEKLPPEFTRAERFDGVFFLDFPTAVEKNAIWDLYLTRYELNRSQPRPVDESWTGAEIKSCCRMAAMLETSIVEASTNVVPIVQTSGAAIEQLRDWADNRCLSANEPGPWRKVKARVAPTGLNSAPRRRIDRNGADPELN
jgi:hypothetical protein